MGEGIWGGEDRKNDCLRSEGRKEKYMGLVVLEMEKGEGRERGRRGDMEGLMIGKKGEGRGREVKGRVME